MKLFRKGINFTVLTTYFLIALVLIFFYLTVISNRVNRSYAQVQKSIEISSICKKSSQIIKDVSNSLSEKAKYFVITHETSYAEEYIKERFYNPEKKDAINQLFQVLNSSNKFQNRLSIALTQSDNLAGIELYAMKLAYVAAGITKMPGELAEIEIRPLDKAKSPEAQQIIAQQVLFNEGYSLYQERVNKNCTDIIYEIENQIQTSLNERAKKLQTLLRISAILLLTLIFICSTFFLTLIFTILRPLKNYCTSIRKEEHLNVEGARELKYLAETYNNIHDFDPLTKIYNRRGMSAACQKTAKSKIPVCFMLVDLDDFKRMNDTYGHSAGDYILEKVAALLKESFRKQDAVCRIGGDEFCVLMEDVKIESAHFIVDKIKGINKELARIKEMKDVSISAGMAFAVNGYSEGLFKNADEVLYKVKNKSKHDVGICEVVIK